MITDEVINMFNLRIEEFRLKKKDVAKAVGISAPQLSRILNRKIELKLDLFVKISRVLRMEIKVQLIDNEGNVI